MRTFLLLLLFGLTSCAKISYIVEQGIGQISLEYNDIDNDDFLNDPNQKVNHKQKVKIIQKAKKYFYQYFNLAPTPIYDEVKLLDQPAVTYLVIHSKINKIKPIRTSFPIVGSFPYLGFFKIESAKKFAKEKQLEGFQTYMRPVYAYSTLNHHLWPFHDNILSSFFYYNERSLTELIFHELVHTIIFVGDNVSFNENLAQFISEKMALEYFRDTPEEMAKEKLKKEKNLKLNQKIVAYSKELQELYDQKKKEFLIIQKNFLENIFKPGLKSECRNLKIKNCWPLKQKWNNARFAALGTYEAKRNKLQDLYNRSNLSLKEFVLRLIKLEQTYDDSQMSFLDYIEKEI